MPDVHAVPPMGPAPAELLPVVPFFKFGLAQCAVLIPTAAGARWENVPTERIPWGPSIWSGDTCPCRATLPSP